MTYLERQRMIYNMKGSADQLLRAAQDISLTVDEMVRSGVIDEDCDLHDSASFYVEVACDLIAMLDKYAPEEELIEIERRFNNKISGVRTPYHKKVTSGRHASLNSAVNAVLQTF